MVQNLQQIQSVTSLPQQQQQIGTPRLPPMRTFNDLPAPVSPTATFSTTMSTAAAALTLPQRQQQQKSVSSLSFSVGNPRKQIHQVPPVDAPLTGFTRFAHVPIGFGQPTFGKPSLAAAAAAGVAPVAAGAAAGAATNTTTSSLLGMSLRPLVSSEVGFTARGTDKGKRHAESQVERSSGADGNGDGDDDDDEREEEEERLNAGGGDGRRPHRRRRFVPPPPRPGIEYVHGAGGGLVTSRRTSGRYDEGTVEWINRLDGATHK
ncbi:hypothetical protein B0F90DRAFT_1220144 [Multifurca ochricompacta]|uniref:Uncharacterized protein n=1 Tax=Multifurca ochricompacta TaxID=376703 RepID=A0AAD4QKQ4_9AGAM|nr:hypothetical protein B0F90DRAFT_1220144 [Multifurca ochricompacta]